MNRRLDIQALRGIAVLAVIFFHARQDLFPLGYLGVDVFFVISGFIVTPLIINIQSESLSSKNNLTNLKNFYIRRFYRLAPAMGSTLMLATLSIFLFGNLNDHSNFAKQGLTTLLLIGNIGAYKFSGDYFHHNPNPLIHTWSLSVEEQIYLVLPIFILLIFKSKRIKSKRLIYVYLGIISLSAIFFFIPKILYPIYSILYFSVPETVSYYSPLSRIWEFCLGGIVFMLNRQQDSYTRIRYLTALSGLVFFIFGPLTLSTSLASGLTVFLSAATIYFGGNHKLNNRVTKTLIWVGDRSYSIYLIHMPVIYLATCSPSIELRSRDIKTIIIVAAIGLTIFLGHLSYVLVEGHFRKQGSELSNQLVSQSISFGRLALFFTLFPAVFFLIMIFSIDKNYFGLVHIDKPAYAYDQVHKYCSQVNGLSELPCRFTGGEQKRTLVLIGDSHAVHLSIALNEVAQKLGYQVYFWGDFSNKEDLKAFLTRQKPQAIIVSRYWKRELLNGPQGISQDIIKLKQYTKRVIIVGATPVFPDALQYMNQRSVFANKYNAPHTFKIEMMDLASARGGRVIRDFSLKEKLEFIDPTSQFCDLKVCWRWINHSWLYYDDDHLSINGANLLKPLFVSALK